MSRRPIRLEPGTEAFEQASKVIGVLAFRMRRKGHEVDDLIQEGWLGLLQAREPFMPERVSWGTYVWSKASSQMRHALRYRQQRILEMEQASEDIPCPADPEPTERIAELLAVLSDRRAEVVTLACGLDGGPPRTCDQVGWMIGRDRPNVHRDLRAAIQRLRGVLTQDL